jgi:RHS repeat-associated protein
MNSARPILMSEQAPFAANVVPPSPEAATLAAYADIPVDLYTGIPEISIPLYELKERDLAVPINLSYHAAAHKVEDQASRVGLGWGLRAGGAITRTIRGLPDEYGPGGFLHQAAEVGQVGAYAGGTDEQRLMWYDAMARGCRSVEPNIYYFNFGTYTGTFQFDWDASIHIASTARLNINPIGLNPDDDSFIQGWTVVTPDGIRWTFDAQETVATRYDGGAVLADPCRTILETQKPPQTWHLTEIQSPFTNSHVRFSYTGYLERLERWSLETQVHGEGLSPSFPQREKLTSVVNGKYLTAISTSSGDTVIEFVPGPNRTDVTGEGLQALGEIRVRNRDAALVKAWNFGYDNSTGRLTLKSLHENGQVDSKPPFTFEYHPGQLPGPLSFRQDHWGHLNNNPIQTLIPRTVVTPIPGIPMGGPVELDGADRSSDPGSLTVAMLKRITYPTGGSDKFDFEPHDYSFEQDVQLRSPVTTSSSIGGSAPAFDTPVGQEHIERVPFTLTPGYLDLTLNASFTYGVRFGGGTLARAAVEIEASDGQTVFTLAPGGAAGPEGEPTIKTVVMSPNVPAGTYVFVVRCKVPPVSLGRNSVAASLSWEEPTGEFTTRIVQGAGVRIARVTRTYGFGNPDRVVAYRYSMLVNGEEISSGSLLEAGYVYEEWLNYSSPPGPDVLKFVRFSENRAALGTTRGSHVGYKQVTVLMGLNGQNGRTVSTYTSAIDFPDLGINFNVPYAPAAKFDHKRGLLVERADYSAGADAPVRRIVNTYNFVQRSIPALKVGWLVPGLGQESVGRYAVSGYANILGYGRLASKEDYLYEPPNSFTMRASYEFDEDSHKQLKRETATSAEGTFITEYRYPSDYAPGTSAGLDELVELGVAGALVEKVYLRDDGLVISAERSRYGLFDGRVHQSHVEVARIDGDLVARDSPFDAVAHLYEVRRVCHAYDTTGNILEFSQPAGMVTAFIWDSAGTQLLAIVDNARHAQVFYDGFEDRLEGTTTAEAHTGSRSQAISGTYTIDTAFLPSLGGGYVLSYWIKVEDDPWTRKERIIEDYVPGTPIATDVISGFIDEVRLHPLDAQMTTFAHESLIGLRTQADANGLPTYYEYDSLGRLSIVRKHDGDIQLHYEYRFGPEAGHPAGPLTLPSYVRTYTALASGITGLNVLTEGNHLRVEQSTAYLDGMARPIQIVQRRASPDGEDVISIIQYDDLGREPVKYLPFLTGAADGAYQVMDPPFTPLLQFYSSEDAEIARSAAPFARTVFDGSPLNRVSEIGSPGEAWQPDAAGGTHTRRMEYRGNTLEDRVLRWRLVARGVRAEAVYPPNALRVDSSVDEHSVRSAVFYDGLDREVLRSIQTPSGEETRTYFVYDAHQNLAVMISPNRVAQLRPGAPRALPPKSVGPERLKRDCYRYRVDHRGRVVEKGLPGAESVAVVYDPWDRIALSQDGDQHSGDFWTFNKYDARDRLIMSGEVVISGDRRDLEAAVEKFYASGTEELRFEISGEDHGYSNRSFPRIDDTARIDRVFYFDDYSFVSALAPSASYNFEPALGVNRVLGRVVGQETGSKVRVFQSEDFISSVMYYDEDYRPVQVISSDLIGGTNRQTILYNFTGGVTRSLIEHESSGSNVRVEQQRDYDHAQRATGVIVTIDDQDPVIVCSLKHNALGQLAQRKLHSVDGGANFADKTDYRYNIRGWLTSINGAALAGEETSETLFAMQATYEGSIDSLPNDPQFNGNISAVSWKTVGMVEKQAYIYTYDGFDRLTAARYRVNGPEERAFDEARIGYDANGNIRRLVRHGFVSSGRAVVDRLTLRYRGNQIRSIRDRGLPHLGFHQASIDGDAYEYDLNGNMVVDRNQGISVRYNRLNLIDEVRKGSGEVVRFGFGADGLKRFRETLGGDSAPLERLDYVGDLIFVDGALRMVMHDYGRLVREPDGDDWRFQYFLTDHLGSVRVAFEVDGDSTDPARPTVVYAADYYPLGLPIFRGGNGDDGDGRVKHLFGGKELQDSVGLEWYDFGARMLDPAIGRWFGLDPKAEDYPSVTPYGYVVGNPLRYVDPDGRDHRELTPDEDGTIWVPSETIIIQGKHKSVNGDVYWKEDGAYYALFRGHDSPTRYDDEYVWLSAQHASQVFRSPTSEQFYRSIAALEAAMGWAVKTADTALFLTGVYGVAKGIASVGGRALVANIAARGPTPLAETLHLSVSQSRLTAAAQLAQTGNIRWVAGDLQAFNVWQAATNAARTQATGRYGYRLLRGRMSTGMNLTGVKIHHYRYPMNVFSGEAMAAESMYLSSQAGHMSFHQVFGVPSRPFQAMAWGAERELQMMFNFWIK